MCGLAIRCIFKIKLNAPQTRRRKQKIYRNEIIDWIRKKIAKFHIFNSVVHMISASQIGYSYFCLSKSIGNGYYPETSESVEPTSVTGNTVCFPRDPVFVCAHEWNGNRGKEKRNKINANKLYFRNETQIILFFLFNWISVAFFRSILSLFTSLQLYALMWYNNRNNTVARTKSNQ